MTRWQDRHKVIPAAYIIFRDEDKVLLLKRANTGYRDGWYSLPSGHVDGGDGTGGEPAVQAAIREAKEEVGVDIAAEDLKLVHTMHRVAEEGGHERIDLYFEAAKWLGEIVNSEPEKCSELCWALTGSLPENIIPAVKFVLENIANGQVYSDFNF